MPRKYKQRSVEESKFSVVEKEIISHLEMLWHDKQYTRPNCKSVVEEILTKYNIPINSHIKVNVKSFGDAKFNVIVEENIC